ncbi:hypothetical protein ACFLTJ_03235 [Chloroflexota bacterium]
MLLQETGKRLAGELSALVGVEDIRRAMRVKMPHRELKWNILAKKEQVVENCFQVLSS